MDVFALRDRLVADYEEFTRSFITVRDPRIEEVVDRELDEGLLWPESLIQLNPSFAPGATIDELAAQGVLHDANRSIFRRGKSEGASGAAGSTALRLHRHQEDAIRVAATGANYVLTTGTGSGKSLTYIVPIVDRVLRDGPGKGIRAIVIYPMNALANSQAGELEKFLKFGFPNNDGPVTYARYTGQENQAEREAIIAKPPDILLTNYVMLELLLTRPYEKGLIEAAKGLRFLVLDELHTYRGRQGADVALLVRRVTLRMLRDVDALGTDSGVVSVCENRSIIEAIADRLGSRSAPLMCTSGEPSMAARRLVAALVQGGARLRYHGDFDPDGVAIANGIIGRGIEPWRFGADDYLAAVASTRALDGLRGPAVDAEWDPQLRSAMTATGVVVCEEQVLDALIADLAPADLPVGDAPAGASPGRPLEPG